MLKLFIIGLMFTSLLIGCGVGGVEGRIHNRTHDYLEARSVDPLKIPSSFKAQPTSPLTIPAGETATESVSFAPPGIL